MVVVPRALVWIAERVKGKLDLLELFRCLLESIHVLVGMPFEGHLLVRLADVGLAGVALHTEHLVVALHGAFWLSRSPSGLLIVSKKRKLEISIKE